jgi:hypothetical protein
MGSQRRWLPAFCVALTASPWLAGCGTDKTAAPASPASDTATAPSPSSAPSSAEAAGPAAPRTENWTALQAGDCLAEAPPTDPAVVMVSVVDCGQPHLAETFLRAPIPVDAALDATASTECEAGFVEYTGGPSAGSGYIITYLIDSEQDRTYNNPLPSTVICLLQDPQGQSLTGSARR